MLDLMLPDGSGFDLLGQVRADGRPHRRSSSCRAATREADRVAALETGADDYVTKPFSPREIVARVRAVLRRARPREGAGRAPARRRAPAAAHGRRGDAPRRSCSAAQLELTRVEFDLLACLLERPGRVFTRAQLIDRVWGDGFAITDRTIDSHVKSLRRRWPRPAADPA